MSKYIEAIFQMEAVSLLNRMKDDKYSRLIMKCINRWFQQLYDEGFIKRDD